MAERNYLVRADGEWVRDRIGRLVKFSERGAHRWADRNKPCAYSVVRQTRTTDRASRADPRP